MRFENLAGDVERCVSALELDATKLPHVNRPVSTRMALDAVEDPAVRKLIAERFAEDCSFFDYPVR